jgi:hypothetical protein
LTSQRSEKAQRNPPITVDLSVIEDVARFDPVPNRDEELIQLEVRTLDEGRIAYMAEKDKIEIQRLTLQLTNAAQDIQLRQSFSRQILGYLWAFSVFCAAISLPSSVLVTLVGGTAASAFGLVSVVLGGLFRSPITTTKDRKSQRP